MDRLKLFISLAVAIVLLLANRNGASAVDATQPVNATLDFGGPEAWNEYTGDIDKNIKIGMTLHVDRDGKAGGGCYYYCKYCKDIRIEAKLDGRKIVINEFDADGKATGKFTGEFAKSDPRHQFRPQADGLGCEVMVGTWAKPDGSGGRPFYLQMSYRGIVPKGKCRYWVAGFDDEPAVDRFMARFRTAILDHHPEQVVAMIRFPIEVKIDGKKQTVENAAGLEKHFDEIFHAGYVRQIRAAAACHMFSRDSGVMLGDGAVWMAPYKDPHGGDGAPIKMGVIALNN